ncbi:hypothetical protein ACLB2K_052912 [Fragaria x ananassa]
MSAFDEILKVTPPALVAFLANLPIIEGPTPDVDIVLSICLQSDIPAPQPVKSGTAHVQFPSVPAPSTSDLSVSRKDEDETTVQSQPLPTDAFRIRQIQRASRSASASRTASQTGSVSYGSAISGDLSGSTG